ncbi:MAG TPA: nodulation protein NfeD [Candidatus Marinimicrobia bacterium]|jgi:membrane-bound serine protease (ClpP class)|nr:nodulation protein NfeD [Candidatus Neomarinimicrobiota bacterium]HQE94945.1 nodulation protein NfeD [Candidatus Neomarinimicrobiota bacterium]HQK10490.1 nodulation protein NfeD [Candidatus Neomarinimicrobiota bacterium]
MRSRFYLPKIFLILLVGSILLTATPKEIWVLEVDGVINPVSASYINDNLRKAQPDQVECLIIQMDTPGGLMTSMRDIIKNILNSEIPVVVYVSPRGAQCASAGVFIAVSAHFVAMSPGTNIGAAHPVNLGGGGIGGQPDSASSQTMIEKATNDAVAYIRSLARERGRNEDWLEKAVRESASITETEAVKLQVVDVVVDDLDELLEILDGKTFKLPSGEKTVHTQEATIRFRPVGIHHRILDVISDPTVAYILLMLGFYGIYFELSNPGAIFPGVLGAIFLILAFFAFQVLPINYAGLALIILGIILFILEVKIISYGLLTIGGIVAMTLGSLMLIDVNQAPEILEAVSLKVILPIVIFTAAFVIISLTLALKAHKRKPTTGIEGMIGETGQTITDVDKTGMAIVHGEYWKVRSDTPIPKGTEIVVLDVDRMVLKVKPK